MYIAISAMQVLRSTHMKRFTQGMKSALAVGLVALSAAVVPIAHANPFISAPFQGVTFTINVIDADTFTFTIAGATTATGDWAGIQFLSAFDFKDLGQNFSAGNATAIATYNSGAGGPYAGANNQLSAANISCSAGGSPNDSICFNINPDLALLASMTFTIDITNGVSLLTSIGAAGPHLQIAFTNTQGGDKVGTLYSQNIASSSGSSSGSSGQVSEPNSGMLALLGLVMLGSMMWLRRRSIS
jgi:PEP-CTERM motif-containing protein